MKVLNTEQIAILFFEHRLKVTQRRLEKLCKKRKKIKRIEINTNQPYCYYLPDKKQPQQIEHVIMTNWLYIWFRFGLRNYESIFHFSYEQQNEIFRYDGLIAIENKFTKEIRFYFIEVDLSNNEFDKVKKYNKFYREKLYEKQWWIQYVKRFPVIIVLTHREKAIENKIEKENINGLEFKIYGMNLITEMRKLVK